MRVRKVNRYYCDHCRKAGQSARWMKHHEESCTSNPKRVCRMCGHAVNAAEVLASIPESIRFNKDDLSEIDELGMSESCEKEFIKLVREKCDNCPVCMWSVIKATGLPGGVWKFNLKEEIAEWWNEKNDWEKEERSQMYG